MNRRRFFTKAAGAAAVVAVAPSVLTSVAETYQNIGFNPILPRNLLAEYPLRPEDCYNAGQKFYNVMTVTRHQHSWTRERVNSDRLPDTTHADT